MGRVKVTGLARNDRRLYGRTEKMDTVSPEEEKEEALEASKIGTTARSAFRAFSISLIRE